MILRLSSVIDFLVVEMRVLGQNPIDDGVIFCQASKKIFLLNKIQTNCFIPVQFAYLGEEFLVLLRREELESEKDEASRKFRILLSNLVIDLIKDIHKFLFVMLLDEIAFSIVFIQFRQKSSELYSVISILYEFKKHMPSILFEDVQGKNQNKEIADFFLKTVPHLLLNKRHCHQFFSAQHCDRRNCFDE